jgi:hypothetical protein
MVDMVKLKHEVSDAAGDSHAAKIIVKQKMLQNTMSTLNRASSTTKKTMGCFMLLVFSLCLLQWSSCFYAIQQVASSRLVSSIV